MNKEETFFLVAWHDGMCEANVQAPERFTEAEEWFVQHTLGPLFAINQGISWGEAVFGPARMYFLETWITRRLDVLDANSWQVLRKERREFVEWYCLFLATLILDPYDLNRPNWPHPRTGLSLYCDSCKLRLCCGRMAKNPKIIVIVGPTASGKSSLAIKLAKEFDGEVIQADSRTIYREMDIGTAKPRGEWKYAADYDEEKIRAEGIHAKTAELRIRDLFKEKPLLVEGIPHWGIDLVNPDEEFTAAQFKVYAESKIFAILNRGKVPILAGGTGLYISAVVDNLQFTDAPPNIELRKELDALSNAALVERLREIDPEAADTMDLENRRRILRAIEIVESTGEKLSKQQLKGKAKFDPIILGMDVDRDILYENINARADEMIVEGLIDEVRKLKEKYGCEGNAMTGIGYRQICAFFDGYLKLSAAVDVMKRDTRHYAKRQLTWFRRDQRIKWIKGVDEAMELVGAHL